MKLILLLTIIAFSSVYGGDKYVIDSIGSSAPGQVKVVFSQSAAPSDADAGKIKHWAIDAISPAGITAGIIKRAQPNASDYTTIPIVTLNVQFPPATGWPAGTLRYRVTYSQDGQLATRTELITRPEDPDAKKNTDNDLTLFGGINSAVGAKPTYKIDAAMDFHPLLNGFGIVAKAKTDNRRKIDPDSFSAKLDYRYLLSTPRSSNGKQVVFQGAEILLNYAGVEFDRKGKNFNFVSSPYLVLPFNFYTASKGAIANVFGLDLKLGMEAGSNFRNSLDENGYGGFLRTLAGGAGNVTLRTVPGFTKVVLTSSYEVRLPNKAELFGTTSDAGTTSYVYSRKSRHWVSNSVNFFFNDHWSLSAEHSYGSLPPAFNFTDQQLSLGLKFTLKTK